MKKIIKTAPCFILAVFYIFSPLMISADAPPQGRSYEQNWSLVSFNCPLSHADLVAALGEGIKTYTWENGQFTQTQALEPGHGYFLNIPGQGTETLCEGILFDMADLRLDKGWNLIGNPTRDSVAFSTFIKPTAAEKDVRIYTLSQYGFEPLTLDDIALPGKGYWVFIPEQARLRAVGKHAWDNTRIALDWEIDISPLPSGCRVSQAQGTEILIPMTSTPLARVSTQDNQQDAAAGAILNDIVEWRSADPEVADIVGSNIVPKAPGTTTINMFFNGQSIHSQTIGVINPERPVCLQIDAPDMVSMKPGQAVFFTVSAYYYAPDACQDDNSLCPFVRKNITGIVTWNVGNPSGGFMEGNMFHASSAFDYSTLSAQYDKQISQTIQLSTKNTEWGALSISTNNLNVCDYNSICRNNLSGYHISTGDQIPLKVKGLSTAGAGSEWRDITGIVTLTSSNPAIAEIWNNTLIAKAEGLVTVTATLPGVSGVASQVINFSVDGGGLAACIAFDEETTDAVESRDKYTLNVYAYSFPEDKKQREACQLVKSERLTDVSFSNSNPAAGEILGDVFHAAFVQDENTAVFAEWKEFRTVHLFRVRAFTIVDFKREFNYTFVENNACDSLTRKETVRLVSGEKVRFHFSAQLGYEPIPRIYQARFENFDDYVMYDITDPSVVRVKDGYLEALAPGVAVLRVVYPGMGALQSYRIAVSDPMDLNNLENPVCLLLVDNKYDYSKYSKNTSNMYVQKPYVRNLNKSASFLMSLYAVYVTGASRCESPSLLSRYCLQDVTGEADWRISNPDFAQVDHGVITTYRRPGDFRISASWNGLNSDIIDFSVKEYQIKTIDILFKNKVNAVDEPSCTVDDGVFVVGDKVPLFITTDSYFPYNISDLTEFQSSDPDIARVNDRYLEILKPGIFFVHARYLDYEAVRRVKAVDRNSDQPLCMVLSPGQSAIVQHGIPRQINAKAVYPSAFSACETFPKNSKYCFVDVSDEATWSSINPSLASVVNGLVTAGTTDGSTFIIVKYNQLPPRRLSIYIQK